MLITAVAILSHRFPDGPARVTAFGVWGVFSGLAVAFGPMIGGVLVDGLNWRWIFLLNVPVVLGLMAVAQLRVAESRDPAAGRLDRAGMAVFTAALVLLSFAIIQGNDSGWGSPLILGCLAAAATLLVAFYRQQVRRARPMFDFSLFRVPTFAGAELAGVAMSASYWAVLMYLPPFFQTVLGTTALQSGVAMLALTVPMLFLPPDRSGMATGIDMTFRHGSFTVAIALMGAVLAFDIGRSLRSAGAVSPADVARVANAMAVGDFASAGRGMPNLAPDAFAASAKQTFLHGLNVVLQLAGISALVGATATAVLIRPSRRGDHEEPAVRVLQDREPLPGGGRPDAREAGEESPGYRPTVRSFRDGRPR